MLNATLDRSLTNIWQQVAEQYLLLLEEKQNTGGSSPPLPITSPIVPLISQRRWFDGDC